MAGLKIMLAIALAAIAIGFFFPMLGEVLAGRDRYLGPIIWLIIFGLAAAAVNWAIPKPRAGT